MAQEFLVHRAVDGQSFAFPPGAVFDSLDSLRRAVGELVCIECSDVIAFFGNGEQVRDDNVLQAGTDGWDELYVFSKDTLQTEASEVIASLEIKKVPPVSTPGSSVAQSLAVILDSHVYPLIDTLHTQSRSLTLAAQNLSLHLSTLAQFHVSLQPVANREFVRQRELLKSYRTALWVVERITVDKRLFSGKTRDGERKLGDYVNLKKMAVVEEGCVKLEEELSEKWAKAETSIEELLQGERQIRAVTESQTCDEAEECVTVAERAAERSRELEEQFSEGEVSDEARRELDDLDNLVREKVELLTEIKNSFNAHLVHTLQSISHFQSFIPPMASTLNSLSSTLRSPPGFSHLSRLYSLPLAYGRLLIESYRRLTFGVFFLDQSGKLAEVMARWVTNERRRREKYEAEMKGLLPWDARTTDEVPGLEVSTVGGGTGEPGSAVTRTDVDEFIVFIEMLEQDPGYLELTSSAGLEKLALLSELKETLSKHLAQVDDARAEFDKLVERNLLSKSGDGISRRGSTVDQTLVKALSTEKDELSGALASKDKTIQDLEAQLSSIQEELATAAEANVSHESELEALKAENALLQQAATDLRSDKAMMDGQVSKLIAERTSAVRELSQANIRVQDMDDALLRAKASVKSAAERYDELTKEMERKLKDKGLESERAMRDHISEADGDRAILEHQLAQANVESERQRTQAEADFKSLKDKSTRDLDAIKADLKMQKVSSKSVEVRNKDLASQLEKLTSESSARDKENERLLADALRLARTLKDSAEKLLEAIRSSSLASSLSLQFLNNQETGQPSTTSSTSSLEIPIPASSLAIRKELDIIARFDIRSFEEVILKSFKLVKKWQQKATEYRDKAKDKIAIGHFSSNDLALFLPTRNYTAVVRPWAAFNVNFPHYFLKTSTKLSEYLLTREYHLARITSISEKTVTADKERDSSDSDVGLPVGTTYFVLETEDFTPTPLRLSSKSRRTSSLTGNPTPPPDAVPLHRKTSSSVGRRTSSSLNPIASFATSPIIDRADVRQAFSPPAQNGSGSDYFSRTIATAPARLSASGLSATQPTPLTSPSALSNLPMQTPGRQVVLPTSEEPPSSSSPPPVEPLPSTSPSPPSLHTRARTESSFSPHTTDAPRSGAIPVPLSRPARPPSIASSSSPRHASHLSSIGGPRSFSMTGSHLAKAPPTTASSSEAFGDLPSHGGGHGVHHPLSASMSLPQSAAAAHLSKHSSSSDLGALVGANGGSPGRMSFMSVAASNLGLGKRRSVSTGEAEPSTPSEGK